MKFIVEITCRAAIEADSIKSADEVGNEIAKNIAMYDIPLVYETEHTATKEEEKS